MEIKKYIRTLALIALATSALPASALYFRYDGGNSGSYSNQNYGGNYYAGGALTQTPLSVSCAPTDTLASIGKIITWIASVTGGVGSYSYIWSGTDGLTGYGSVAEKFYTTPGDKFGTVTVSSGSQTISVGCVRALSIVGVVSAPTTVVPVPAKKAAIVATVKQPVKTASALQAFCASSKESTAVITSGTEKILITCDKFATTTAVAKAETQKTGLLAGVFAADFTGFGNALLLALLSIGAILLAIFFARRKQEKEQKTAH